MMTAEDVRRFRREMGVDMIEAQRKEQPWRRIVQDLAEWPQQDNTSPLTGAFFMVAHD